jgi:GT2 family glycosyltransferase
MIPDLSILIVNYKTPGLLIDCLRSVQEHTSGLTVEFVLVDNASGDDSQARLRAAFPEADYPHVRWFDMGYNSGFSRANNFAMAQARGRLLLLLNSDTLLIDNVLNRCARMLDTQPDVAAVAPTQLTRERKIYREAFEKFGQLLRFSLIVPTRFQGLLAKLIPDSHYADPNEVDFLIGSFVMTRRTTVDAAGPLCTDFFMYAEDVEWSHRLRGQGRLLLLRDAFYVHLEYGSAPDKPRPAVSYINRFNTQMQLSNLVWIRKHYGPLTFAGLILFYVGLLPVLFGWKITVNLLRGRWPGHDLNNQRAFARQVGAFGRFFWSILFDRPGFYKV